MNKRKYVTMFEEFNPYSNKELAEKLFLFAQASDVPDEVTPLRKVSGDYVFQIFTAIPSDKRDFGHKMFYVEIPEDIQLTTVLVYEGSKEKGFTLEDEVPLEINGEQDLEVILTNFFEITEIFDDNVIEELVQSCKKLNTVEEVTKLVKTLIPQNDSPDLQ